MVRFSAWSLLRTRLRWRVAEQWRSPEPRDAYDVVIVGRGGHGLATAYYLASEHGGETSPCWTRDGWAAAIPGGTRRSSARTICGRERGDLRTCVEVVGGFVSALNYNVMYSPRGVIMLAHNHHDVQVFRRHVHANRLQGSTTNG